MALRVWLHRSAPNDVAAPWALELFDRCRQYQALPGPGGTYDQDEWLMAAMEQAAGVSALFDAGGKVLIGHDKRLKLHTRLQEEAAAVIAYINAKEAAQKADDDQNA